MLVRPVADDELDDAFALLRAVAAWLQAKGRRQRIAAISRDTYARWHRAGGNHAVELEGRLAGVFTLVEEPLADWPMIALGGAVPWLRALATHPECRGRGVGAAAVGAALAMVPPGRDLYLDCVSDFLPGYYARLGFQTVARQVRDYPGEGSYDITLMRQAGASPASRSPRRSGRA